MSNKKVFVWEGIDAKGTTIFGETESTNLTLAKVEVQSKDIKVTKINIKKANNQKGKKIKPGDIAEFTGKFATLSQSGVAVLRALEIIIESSENPKFTDLISKIKSDVNDGKPLSQAFAAHPNFFDTMYVGLIAAGEDSGSLDIMLERLAEHMHKSEVIKKKVKKALTYPIAILVIAFIVVVVLLMKVVPVFQEMFNNFGAELPAFTQMIVDASEFVKAYWYMLFGGIGITVFMYKQALKRSISFKNRIDRLSLKIPVFGKLIKESLVARFSRVLSTTFSSGVPIIDGLESVERSMGNVVYTDAIIKIREQVKGGASIADSIKATGIFPPTLYHMVGIGEESGSLDTMLNKTADIFDANVNDSVDNLTTLLEPIVMVVLAVILGGLIIGLYLPVFQMGSVAG